MCNFLHSPITSSLLCPNILLSTIFSSTFSPCVISGFRREAAENCALLGCYTASSGNFLPKFWNNLSVPTSEFYSLRNNPEESSSHPQPTFLPQCERPSLTPTQNERKNIVLYIIIFIFLDTRLEDKRLCTE